MYSPLSADRKEIRVLSIHPATEASDSISCSLTTVSLLEDPVYDALSYVWGDATVPSTIRVDGHPFEATNNLVAGLRELRKSSHSNLIWIDAICINQTSIEEKNQQVPLMQDIYRGAQTTLLWLGEAGEESRLAFRLLRRWCTVRAEALELFWTDPDHVDALFQEVGSLGEVDDDANPVDPATVLDFSKLVQSITTGFMGEKLQAAFDLREYNAFIILLSQPYWRRVWIVQEFSLSRQLLLLWGSETIDYKTFSSAYGSLGSHTMVYGLDRVLPDDHLRAISSCVSRPLDTLIELKTRYSQGDEVKHMSLWELISNSQMQKATLPVDRIFSLAGLLEPSDHTVDIDYSRSVVDVFIDVAGRLIEDPAVGLNCLGFVGVGFEKASLPGLPSWVPNFAGPACLFRHDNGFYDWADFDFSANHHMAENLLELDVILGSYVCSVRHWAVSEDPNVDTIGSWLDLALARSPIHPCGLPNLQVFCRTLTFDESGFGFGNPRFRTQVHELGFLNNAAGFLEVLGRLGASILLKSYRQSPGNENSDLPSNDADLLPILGEYLTLAESEALLDLNMHPTLHGFALWLLKSPLKPKAINVDSIIEAFFGSADSEQCLELSDIDKYFHGGSKFYAFLDNFIARSSSRGDTFFMTSNGYMGLGPHEVCDGDTICSVPGCTYPLVIRPRLNDFDDGKVHFEVVGACYVYGMMNGEVANDPNVRQKMFRVVFE
ncbi:hypothetical protein IFR05_008926 [Cadophora sp. M221]|nr:hypothetical protein IFR05_008926 [Cadophora sp. M221]